STTTPHSPSLPDARRSPPTAAVQDDQDASLRRVTAVGGDGVGDLLAGVLGSLQDDHTTLGEEGGTEQLGEFVLGDLGHAELLSRSEEHTSELQSRENLV